jgi:type-F conjugative transfer system pilin assembly protein TrbC
MKKIIIIAVQFISTASFATHSALFVSLAMPDRVLKSYFVQARNYNIPVLIRGLYYYDSDHSVNKAIGSFKDTTSRMSELIKKKDKGGVSIDPILFRSFAVNAVPALVVYSDTSCIIRKNHNTKSCSSSSYDVVYGNIPIKKQLAIIASNSKDNSRSNYAKTLVEKED